MSRILCHTPFFSSRQRLTLDSQSAIATETKVCPCRSCQHKVNNFKNPIFIPLLLKSTPLRTEQGKKVEICGTFRGKDSERGSREHSIRNIPVTTLESSSDTAPLGTVEKLFPPLDANSPTLDSGSMQEVGGIVGEARTRLGRCSPTTGCEDGDKSGGPVKASTLICAGKKYNEICRSTRRYNKAYGVYHAADILFCRCAVGEIFTSS